MKYLKKFSLLLVAIACCSTATLFAATANNFAPAITDLNDTYGQGDASAVKSWLKSKRVALSNKTGDFSLAGEVRASWRNYHSKAGPVDLTGGPSSPSAWSNNLYGVEFVLYLDYKADKTWASIKLDFDNAAGTFFGQSNNLALTRANVGYHLYDDGGTTFDMMIGRQRSYEFYTSQVQFNSTLDGVTWLLNTNVDCAADVSLYAGAYIANATTNFPVWIIQASAENLFGTGVYANYAFTNWTNQTDSTPYGDGLNGGPSAAVTNVAWLYRLNQFEVGYDFNPEMIGHDFTVFCGFLWNAQASRSAINAVATGTTNNKQNVAGWLTARIGSVQQAGDWAFQGSWQYVQAYAVPDWDVAGVSRGNPLVMAGLFTGAAGAIPAGYGNANYKGFEFDFLYSITNELVLELKLQRSLTAQREIGPASKYTNFVVSTIYGF